MASLSAPAHQTPSDGVGRNSNSASSSSSSASSSSKAPSTSSQDEPPRAESKNRSEDDGHEHPDQHHHQHRKIRTLYNTFLSPSGSTSFFSPSWFEFRPIKETVGDKAESVSSSLSSVLSSGASEESKRRPTYEEYRSQEPPQARLIRLRGLFDVLMDKDQREALADGRAKDAWTATARRARYGAGGKLARGSLAKEMHLDREMSAREDDLDADKTPTSDAAIGASGSSNSDPLDGPGSSKEPATPSPPRSSYASELLAQCRQCLSEVETERAKRTGDGSSASISPSSDTWLPESLRALWPGSKTESDEEGREASSSAYKPRESLWYSFTGSNREVDDAALEADHDGESGYQGSGVWGLSAVKGGSRDRERQRLREAENPSAEISEGDADGAGDHHQQTMIEWEGFMKYAETKERELYKIFSELDKNGDMRLDVSEIRTALDRAGISLSSASLEDFIASLSSSTKTSDPHATGDMWYTREGQPQFVTWPEFRDYLLLLPRKPSVGEIFRFYQVRKAFGLFGIGGIFSEFSNKWGTTERHQATSLTSDGDVIAAGEEKKRSDSSSTTDERSKKSSGTDATKSASSEGTLGSTSKAASDSHAGATTSGDGQAEDEEDDNDMIQSDVALKFLLAGGIAGAVSRTATAPFDRLKIFLITASRSADTASMPAVAAIKQGSAGAVAKDAGKVAAQGLGVLGTAVRSLYIEGGGLKAFWTGNGLNCVKIFPESAIKFLSYETCKRAFAKYVDNVSDSRDISGTSRFISGGMGGITSQLAIYPIETLKTRLMSSQGSHAPTDPATGAPLKGNPLLLATAKQMWKAGGLRVYYRGLVAGLVGVFPYSAIDMSTFEGIKLAYISYTGKEEPGTLALLAFGSFSGSVGATTVYPLNLIRTRLQAAGTPAHPQVYDGFVDAVKRTYAREGVVGFYRGLVPTLAKVVPAVSISYVCYENSKKRLGVA